MPREMNLVAGQEAEKRGYKSARREQERAAEPAER